MKMYRTIYLMHPFGGKQENLDLAVSWCGFLSLYFDAFFVAPWVPLAKLWPDEGEYQKRAFDLNASFILGCDGAFATGGKYSSGMQYERSIVNVANKSLFDATQFVTPNQLLADEKAFELVANFYGRSNYHGR